MRKILTVLLFVIFSIPLFQYSTKLIPKRKLFGASNEFVKPELTFSSYQSGKYQKEFESYYLQKNGLFPQLTVMNNTINYRLFKLASGKYDNFYLGKQNSILEKMHLDDYNGLIELEAGIHPRLERVKKFQDYLESQGKQFVVVIHPNKYVANPEWQSSIYSVNKQKKRRIDMIIPLLDKLKINYIQLSKELDEEQHFPNSGAHLRFYSKCKAVKIISDYLNKKSPGFLPDFNCVPSGKMIEYSGEELDLAKLLNVSSYAASMKPTEDFEVKINRSNTPLDLLIVGTSFSFGLQRYLAKSMALNSCDLLFYSSKYFKYRGLQNKKPGTRTLAQTPDMYSKEFLDQHNFVIFEITEHRIGEIGYKFLADLNLN